MQIRRKKAFRILTANYYCRVRGKRVINRKEMSLTRQVNNRVIMENKFQRDFRIKREKLDWLTDGFFNPIKRRARRNCLLLFLIHRFFNDDWPPRDSKLTFGLLLFHFLMNPVTLLLLLSCLLNHQTPLKSQRRPPNKNRNENKNFNSVNCVFYIFFK